MPRAILGTRAPGRNRPPGGRALPVRPPIRGGILRGGRSRGERGIAAREQIGPAAGAEAVSIRTVRGEGEDGGEAFVAQDEVGAGGDRGAEGDAHVGGE